MLLLLFLQLLKVFFLCIIFILESSIKPLVKGDAIELLVKLISSHFQHYLITGYSLYALYLLAQCGIELFYSISFNRRIY